MTFASAVAHAADDYGVLRYPRGGTFRTGVFEPRYIGRLPAEGKSDYLLFSGLRCKDCGANRTLYLHSPDDGPMLGDERDARALYPGDYHDEASGELQYAVRVFHGRCLGAPASAHVVLWFGTVRQEDGDWQASVHVAEVERGRLVQRRWEGEPPSLAQVMARVKRNACRELRGGRMRAEF